MSELVVFVFRDEYRAPEVLNELRRRDWPWIRDLDEAVAVTLNDDGRARVHLSVDLSKCEATGWAGIWGSLLSTTLYRPLTEVMVAEVAGLAYSSKFASGAPPPRTGESRETQWWQDSLHPSENFQRDVAALIAPNRSAIFMLLRTARVPVALEQLRNYGNTILHTSVSAEQDIRLNAMLACTRRPRL